MEQQHDLVSRQLLKPYLLGHLCYNVTETRHILLQYLPPLVMHSNEDLAWGCRGAVSPVVFVRLNRTDASCVQFTSFWHLLSPRCNMTYLYTNTSSW